jgi:hypothetical protein
LDFILFRGLFAAPDRYGQQARLLTRFLDRGRQRVGLAAIASFNLPKIGRDALL